MSWKKRNSIRLELLNKNVPVKVAIRNRKCTCCQGVIPKGELHLLNTYLIFVKNVKFKVPHTENMCVLCIRGIAQRLTKSLRTSLWKRVQAWTRSTLGTKWTRRFENDGVLLDDAHRSGQWKRNDHVRVDGPF